MQAWFRLTLMRLRAARPTLGQRGAVAVMLAFSLLPLVATVGIAVDYSFYVASRSQLGLAADAAAMHAVRVASQAYNNGGGTVTLAAAQAAGVASGQQWFAAQLGNFTMGSVSASNIVVNVTYTASPSSFSASVTANGSVPTHFGSLFHIAGWTIASSSTAVISSAYVEVLMLLDNSPSMLLGATATDIIKLQQATPCSMQASLAGQPMNNYSWLDTSPYGWKDSYNAGATAPTVSGAAGGHCDPSFTGASATCFAVPTASMPVSGGICTNGGGGSGGYSATNTPQAPCAFACHNSVTTTIYPSWNPGTYTGPQYNDYFGLARSIGITLRLDVVQSAAKTVIQNLSASGFPGQFSVGVYQFNTVLQQVYPILGLGEAGTDLTTAASVVNNLQNTPALSSNAAETNFVLAANTLAAQVTSGGTGLSAATPQKNLFIVTDGMEDAPVAGNQNAGGSNIGTRFIGAMTSTSNETICQQFKNKGFTVYVLYTAFLPVPNPWYFQNVQQYAEPTYTSTNVQALQACASSPSTFFPANSPTDINNAMQTMLASALNKPGRIAN